MISTIIFDFFGVFASSMATNWFKTTAAATQEGLATFQTLCTMSDLGQLSKNEFINKASELTGISAKTVAAGIEEQLQVNQELVDYAEVLINHGYRLACLSNGSHEWTTYAIHTLDIAHLFEKIVISSEIKMVKPDPRIYLYTLKLLNTSADQCIFVDDRLSNVQAAEALGIKSFLFKTTDEFRTQFTKYVNV